MAKAALSGETITVACKLPHGIILRTFDMVPTLEAVAGGGFREVQRAQPTGHVIELKGYLAEAKKSKVQMPAEASFFAFTKNVNREIFERWLAENQDHASVVNGLIFMHVSDTEGAAKDRKDLKNGFDPIDPTKVKGRVSTYSAKDEAAA